MKFQYTMGDWSYDGHNISETFQLECAKGKAELQVANKQVAELIGRIGGFQSLCEEYEDCYLPPETVAALIKAGIDVENLMDGEVEEGEKVYVSGECLLKLWIAAMNLVDKELHLTQVAKPEDLCYSLGSMGYGCYEAW